jgi:hypothetical protein
LRGERGEDGRDLLEQYKIKEHPMRALIHRALSKHAAKAVKATRIVAFAGAGVVAAIAGGCASNDAAKAPKYSQEQMMQTMMSAGTPGEMHAKLANYAGTWKLTNTMWMSEGSEPIQSDGTIVTRLEMDGRYAASTYKGQMPGMGAFEGVGIVGYDNARQKFVGTWYDNFSTGMMQGVGTPRSDAGTGLTIDWVYTYFCPITKGITTMRQTDMMPDPNTMVMEAFMRDPNTGVEYRGMRMECTRVQ